MNDWMDMNVRWRKRNVDVTERERERERARKREWRRKRELDGYMNGCDRMRMKAIDEWMDR